LLKLQAGKGRRGATADHHCAAREPCFAGCAGQSRPRAHRAQAAAEALASFDKALALDPDHFEALANRGNLLLDLDRAEEALVCFVRVLALEPRHVPARVNRGNALLALGEVEAAIREYDDALGVSPAIPRR
jgi:tetratricopeptide (TPR) repeat protein